ncbi:tropinone reductase homolog At2g29260, chloroplastic-like [Camellia sinensis]|uniref:tropinone reductase homolog At2g29260, chloroplastic-like n=1 Tax=Camellia sinensis TaxID=4442 RepID=UPI001036AAA2|nr:tropinone reductase homolog At2g29260, chloroplastic-like [Camellia sinensis]
MKKAKENARVTTITSDEEKDLEDTVPISKLAESKKRLALTDSVDAPPAKKPRSIGLGGKSDILPEDTWLPEIQVGDQLLKVSDNVFKDIEVRATLTTGLLLYTDLSQISKYNHLPNSKRWSLHGMTALVTGGTRGIRHANMEELTGLGVKVHTCARHETKLKRCLGDWEDERFGVTGSVCDVSSCLQLEELMDSISFVFNGKLNILVNNDGTNIRKPMVEFTAKEYATLFATNFESVFHMCQLAHPLLKASRVGNVVFTSPVFGFVSLKFMSVHEATKGAINQLTRNLACEWAKDNIRSNAVSPWYIKTSLVEQVISFSPSFVIHNLF